VMVEGQQQRVIEMEERGNVLAAKISKSSFLYIIAILEYGVFPSRQMNLSWSSKKKCQYIPSLVKPSFVSPKPCKKIKRFNGGPFSGGTISQRMFGGKSSLVGRRGSGSVADIWH